MKSGDERLWLWIPGDKLLYTPVEDQKMRQSYPEGGVRNCTMEHPGTRKHILYIIAIG